MSLRVRGARAESCRQRGRGGTAVGLGRLRVGPPVASSASCTAASAPRVAGSPDKEKTINPEQASAIAPYSKALYRRAKSSEPVHITTTILLLLNMTFVAMST